MTNVAAQKNTSHFTAGSAITPCAANGIKQYRAIPTTKKIQKVLLRPR